MRCRLLLSLVLVPLLAASAQARGHGGGVAVVGHGGGVVVAGRVAPHPFSHFGSFRVDGRLINRRAVVSSGAFVFASPVLARPLLVSPVLARPVLISPVLARPVLISPVLARPVLASPVLVSSAVVPPVVPSAIVPKVLVNVGNGVFVEQRVFTGGVFTVP